MKQFWYHNALEATVKPVVSGQSNKYYVSETLCEMYDWFRFMYETMYTYSCNVHFHLVLLLGWNYKLEAAVQQLS